MPATSATALERKRLNAMYYAMKARCYNKNDVSYDNIGAKGIGVDDVWLGPKGFEAYAAWCLSKGWILGTDLVIDREDKTKNYGPTNCLFVSKLRKANSKANTRMVETDDGRKISFRQFYDENCIPNGVSYSTAHNRLTKLGMSALESVTSPPVSIADSNRKRCLYA